MLTKPPCQKFYQSAHQRFLHASIQNFFATEFPKTFGPVITAKIAHHIVELVDSQLPHKDYLRPGQLLWNAVSIDTRPDSHKLKLIPVILTMIHPDDILQLTNGTPMPRIGQLAIARITKEAHQQGALLTMRDISLLVWRGISAVSAMRIAWEKTHNEILPHCGSLQDFGSCISHKTMIIRKAFYEKKDPLSVARETKHSQRAVDRYLKDFHRVRNCYLKNSDLDFITSVTGLSRYLVRQYLAIIDHYEMKVGTS